MLKFGATRGEILASVGPELFFSFFTCYFTYPFFGWTLFLSLRKALARQSSDSIPALYMVVSDGPAPSGDTVTITKAKYKSDKSELKVEATSSDQPSVTLTVVSYGNMTWKNDKYEYKGKGVANPGATVTVTSSGGGQDTANVTHK